MWRHVVFARGKANSFACLTCERVDTVDTQGAVYKQPEIMSFVVFIEQVEKRIGMEGNEENFHLVHAYAGTPLVKNYLAQK